MNAEKRKIKRLLNEIPENQRTVGDRILKELFFMFDMLDSLKKQIETEGAIVDFKNGKQEMKVQNPAFKAYNETMPKFNKFLNDFLSLLPKDLEPETINPILQFKYNE